MKFLRPVAVAGFDHYASQSFEQFQPQTEMRRSSKATTTTTLESVRIVYDISLCSKLRHIRPLLRLLVALFQHQYSLNYKSK